MGMFDSFFDANDNDWQTKAFGRSLAQWSVGDEIPGAHPLPFQVAVLGSDIHEDGDFVESFATVRGGRLTAVPAERDESLPLLNFGGSWAPAPGLVAEVERLRAAADGLNDVLLHWRDRAAGYMAAPPFKSHSMTQGPMAYERAAGLVRDLRDGKLDAAEIERLTHFGEDGPCTAYDYRDRESSDCSSTGSEL